MILVGSQRSGAIELANHLLNDRDNDHVTLLETQGFMSEDLHEALSEAYAASKATRCKQYLFSLSLNPPEGYEVSEEELLKAIERAGETLGLSDQPRAVVLHEKEGRRHAHAVWSRIDGDQMKAINMPHFKNKLRNLSKELFLDHGWQLPKGLQTYGDKSPLNFTLDEWQHAKRVGLDPREFKQMFREAWERSDSQAGFKNALEEKGYFLARGDRRGFVAMDTEGNLFSIAKWTSVKAKDVRNKLGSPENLKSVDETRAYLDTRVSDQMRGYLNQFKARQREEFSSLHAEVKAMTKAHRVERYKMQVGQEKRWQSEAKHRSDRLNKGLRGLFDRLTGTGRKTKDKNLREAIRCAKRDRDQRDRLVMEQMRERRKLKERQKELKEKQRKERHLMMRDVVSSLRRLRSDTDKSQRRTRRRGVDLSL
ncbi:relaxase/mobilization nuclease domain-containing protein [Shimia sp. R9_2]|uniref:relaxase/mobilization nuclease domain-containing protein n=1 Tax=Shimia sp. R9_2 TaxID=2821112 RepID=UPI001ADBF20F|nr:relaxase/mobilization nuclease domain-containing protein [Shimia sp. R9_2]MBO9399159.1 relaxase/mobilization nuclease domain-containing protein [Shimia sp. R9_2]